MNKRIGLVFGLIVWMLTLSIAALADEEEKTEKKDVPPPMNWKPAGEITPPSPTAGAESTSIIPSPMISYGQFELDLHGRVQAMVGLVGDDSHTNNGDALSRDGFRIRRARMGLSGQIVDSWEYELELDLIDEDSGGNALLDAFITWRPCQYAWISAGAGKLPFSRSLMISSANMQFIERSPWVGVEAATGAYMLDPGRQVGLTVGGEVSLFNYSVGVYNGSPGISVGDLNDGLMYVARIGVGMGDMGKTEADLEGGDFRWAFGINGYLNQAPAAEIRASGVDFGLKVIGLSFYAEALWAKSIPASRPESTGSTLDESERWGMSAQVGYVLPFSFADIELACRFSMMDDNVHVENEGDLWELAAGLNAYFYDGHIKVMLNYLLKEEMEGADLSNDSVLAMLQLMF
ncbi:MAG: hypothetical protein JRJ19_06205 [Deltaproteobacteria bacterium]|nr:hypothetical protein [Deltaproteobacteria bacterium]MBW1871638.1 hypothetical protein [Deltaproteobacteria bacterium]